MYILFVIALFVAGFVAKAHGVLPGLAAGVATFAGQFALLMLLGRGARRGQVAAGADMPPAAAVPPQIPDDDAVAPRASDRTRPRDLLPHPLGSGWPGYVGRESYLLPLHIDLGAAPTCWSWRAATWIKGDAAREVFVAQLYERLQQALAEPAAPDRDTVPPVGEDDLARHYVALEGKPRFLAFRSRDARWGGFMHDAEWFRFPLERLLGLHLRIGRPMRGGGGYELCVVLAEGEERVQSLETHLAYDLRTTSSLLIATMQLGKLFDVPVGAEEYIDEWRGYDAARPYDR